MARSPTLLSHAGLSERPKPGCSGARTSQRPASFSKNGPHVGQPPAPCRNTSGSPFPSWRSRTLTSRVLCWISCTAIGTLPAREHHIAKQKRAALLALDARRLDHAAPARDLALDPLAHLLGRRRRGHVAAFEQPLLHVGQLQRGARLLVDAVTIARGVSGGIARPSHDMNSTPGTVSATV